MPNFAFFLLKAFVLALFVAISESLGPFSQLISLCPADRNEPWTYRGRNGPRNWAETYPACNGSEQSPIEIKRANAVMNENLEQLTLNNYDVPVSKATIENNGHTIEVVPDDDVERTISVNGDTYNLIQFHFHWGIARSRGSEHVLDGVRYPMELHFVHRNENGNLAVVGIFFKEELRSNPDLKPIVDELPQLKFKDTEREMSSELNLNNLLPANPTSFYRYNGSLTTPGCAEGVIWSVVPDPISVGMLQMLEFRKLSSATMENYSIFCTLADNYRPVQELNDRQVELSQ